MMAKKRIGKLVFDDFFWVFDVAFPDGTYFGGIALGQKFEILNSHGIWIAVSLQTNGFEPFLQGFDGYGVPVGAFVRII